MKQPRLLQKSIIFKLKNIYIEKDKMNNSNNFDAMMIAFDEGAKTLNE